MPDNDKNKDIPYQPSHPWYYVLGGKVLKPSQIIKDVIRNGYQGYLIEDIEKAANRSEPQRSIALRKIKESAKNDLFSNLSRYREVVRELHQRRKNHLSKEAQHHEIHTSLSLKHNHIYNNLAHLVWLDELLSEQPELDLLASRGGSNGR